MMLFQLTTRSSPSFPYLGIQQALDLGAGTIHLLTYHACILIMHKSYGGNRHFV